MPKKFDIDDPVMDAGEALDEAMPAGRVRGAPILDSQYSSPRCKNCQYGKLAMEKYGLEEVPCPWYQEHFRHCVPYDGMQRTWIARIREWNYRIDVTNKALCRRIAAWLFHAEMGHLLLSRALGGHFSGGEMIKIHKSDGTVVEKRADTYRSNLSVAVAEMEKHTLQIEEHLRRYGVKVRLEEKSFVDQMMEMVNTGAKANGTD